MESRSRPPWWVWAGLGLYALAVGVVVLTPVSYARIVAAVGDRIRFGLGADLFGDGWIEFTANVLLFVPLGLLLTLLFRHPWRGVVLALVLSAGAELAQFVIPSRQPSVRDIIANVLGAAIGAAIAWWIVLRRRRKATRDASVVDPAL